MKIINKVTMAFAALLLANTAAYANLVQGGDFENPALPAGTTQYTGIIPGWDIGYPLVILHNDASTAYSGNQYAELTVVPSGAGSRGTHISQYIPTVAGQDYTLSFAFSPHPGLNNQYNMLGVIFGNVQDDVQRSGLGLSNPNWDAHSYTMTATGSWTLLEFFTAGLATPYDPITGYGPGVYLDDVSVFAGTGAAAPEPASLALFGLGLLSIWGVRKKYSIAK